MGLVRIASCLGLLGLLACAEHHRVESFGDASSRDAARDAGPRDAGADTFVDAPPANNCYEATVAPVGAPCTFSGSCLGGDLCCSTSASCFEGRVARNYVDETCEGEVRPTMCVGAPATLTGETPLGRFDFRFAHASFTFAFAVDAVIVFTEGNLFSYCGGDRFAVWLLPGFDGVGPTYVGTHDAIAQLVVGSEVVRAPAFVEVTEYEEDVGGAFIGRLVGRVRVDAPGWDLRGDFRVVGCEALDRSGP